MYPVTPVPLPLESGRDHVSDAWPWATVTWTAVGALGGFAASAQPGIALHTSSRPPLTTLPDRFDCRSTACTITVRSSVMVRPGCAASASAAAPDTIGVAIEVPSSEQYRLIPQPGITPGGTVETMPSPGAARSTCVAPKSENELSLSSPPLAATQITLGRPAAHG